MAGIFFAFGPGDSYIFSSPKRYKWKGNISKDWRDYAFANSKDGITVYNYATSEDDKYTMVVWTNASNVIEGWRTYSMTKYEGFETFATKYGWTNIRTVFGQNKHFIAWSSRSSATRWFLNTGSWAIKRLQSLGDGMTGLKCAALGVEEACFLMATDDRFWYDLGAYYTTLDEILKDYRAGDIEFLALNPFRVEQFFLLRADNVAIFRVSLSLRDDLISLLSSHDVTCRDLSSQRADQAPKSLPAATREAGFLKGIVKDVAVTTFGSVVGGVASALIGAAACTVM